MNRRLSLEEMKLGFAEYIETIAIVMPYVGVGEPNAGLLSAE